MKVVFAVVGVCLCCDGCVFVLWWVCECVFAVVGVCLCCGGCVSVFLLWWVCVCAVVGE